jgi:tripeptidyl-peptidase-1
MKTGMLRISFLIASQDEGAPSEANEGCTLDSSDHPVFAIYPCSSPYVTCVSGTTIGPEASLRKSPTKQQQNAMFITADQFSGSFPPICADYPCAMSNQEMPCEPNNTLYSWTTGGGFSEYATRPSYQDSVVEAYLSSGAFLPPPSKFPNSANRGYPDVAAVGARILIVSDGSVTPEAGTSASTPIFAGVVALLNEWRINNGKTPLGFLNPTFYTMAASNPDTFHDIVGGDNRCTIDTCCEYGYGAVEGWDSVTGLGTPDYQNMLAYVQTLP